MPEDTGYSEKQNSKLDTEISKSQDPASVAFDGPISIPKGEDRLHKEKETVDKLMVKFNGWNDWRLPLENIWNEIYRLYFSCDQNIKTPTRSKLFVPMIFKLVESALPLIVNTIFSSDSIFDVIPTDTKDKDLAELIKLLLTYQMNQANFYPKFVDFAKQLILYGTSYFKVYWKVKRQWVWEREPIRKPVSILGIPMGERIVAHKETKTYKVVERRPEVDVMDILDVFPDPTARNEKEGEGVFLRSYMSLDDVREMGAGKYPVYANTDSPLLIAAKSGNLTYATSRQRRLSARSLGSTDVSKTKGVEILEFWGLWDIDGDGIREEAYIVIANRQVLLKATGNPFHHQQRPLVRSNLFSVPNEWFGLGIVEPIISDQHELNTLRRQRIDNINQTLNAMWKVLDVADIDLNTLVSSPDGIILTSDMDGIERLEPNDVTQTAYLEAQALSSEMENTTVPQAAQGTPQSGRLGRTASGARMIIAQSLERFGTAVKLIEETAIKRTIKLFHQLNLQFLDDDDILSDPGLYGDILSSDITPEMLRADVKFRMVGIGEMIGNEGKINQIASFLGMFKDTMTPEEIAATKEQVWRLMGFDPEGMANGQGNGVANPQASLPQGQGGLESITNEIAQNGASAPNAATQNTGV
ncbi:MAG: hypothetical protein KAS32_26050 [Candidatus Peribacteraceae bacterium]|nr:hypothetical protein [Candidatus Peribacteraceae bacterium]